MYTFKKATQGNADGRYLRFLSKLLKTTLT